MRRRGCAPGRNVLRGSASCDGISRASRTAGPVATQAGTSTIGRIPSHRAHPVLSEFTDRSPYSVSMSIGAPTGKSVRPILFPKFAANLRLPPSRDVPFANSTIPQHSSPPPHPGSREPTLAGRATPPAGHLSGRSLDTRTSTTNFLATHRDWLMFTYFAAETNWKSTGLPPHPRTRLSADPAARVDAGRGRRDPIGDAAGPHSAPGDLRTPIPKPSATAPTSADQLAGHPGRIPVTTSASRPLDLPPAPL